MDLGCKFHLDARVVSIDPEAGSVVTKDAVTYSADLIVASDGLNSMARAVVLGQPGLPVPTGQMAYRVTLPAAKLRGIPELEEIITVPRNNHWLGPHGTILSYLLEGQNEPLINFVFTCDVNETDLPPGVDQRMGTAKEVRNSFKGWDPRIETMLGYVKDVLYWRVSPIPLQDAVSNILLALHSRTSRFLVPPVSSSRPHRGRRPRHDTLPRPRRCHGYRRRRHPRRHPLAPVLLLLQHARRRPPAL